MKSKYYGNCVGWPIQYADSLTDMIDAAREISRRTFLRHVDLEDLRAIERELGYVTTSSKYGLHMASDWHVSYHKSKLDGYVVHYFRQSAIEYVFVPDNFTRRTIP